MIGKWKIFGQHMLNLGGHIINYMIFFIMQIVPLHDMRVANPYHSCGIEALNLYKMIEPDS